MLAHRRGFHPNFEEEMIIKPFLDRFRRRADIVDPVDPAV
jgi:hypothetical protein